MKKVLFTATLDDHILSFHLPYLRWFKEQGFEVHIASKGNSNIPFVDCKYEISFERSPYKLANLKAYNKLKQIINQNNYRIIHCHTPMGSTLTRLAARKARNRGSKVIYTAHGFHFYKGAPFLNWVLYYTVEKWLSKHTDCLITINKEDFLRVKDRFKTELIELVNGVGIDLKKFSPPSKEIKSVLRKKHNYSEEDFLLIFVGELNKTKHQELLIDTIKLLNGKVPNIKLLLVGDGNLCEQYKRKIKRSNLVNEVKLLGYRKDIQELMMMSDVSISSSLREGLPVNVMEAMATGLPLVVTGCRGNQDLVKNGENGFVVGIDDRQGFADAIEKIYYSPFLIKKFRDKNIEMVSKYSLDNVCEKMEKIYCQFIK